MKNPSTISSGESDERAAFEAWFCEGGEYEPEWLDWHRSGMYSNADTQIMFEAWTARAALATQPAESKACASVGEPDEDVAAEKLPIIEWVVERWYAEVSNRPMVNVHRRSLDDTWRQVLRHLGVDDRARLGPTHDELRAEIGSKDWEAMSSATPPAAPAATEAPSGFQTVPVEPTEEMMSAGLYQSSKDSSWADVYSMWKDMLAVAAQKTDVPPAPAVGASPIMVAQLDELERSGELTARAWGALRSQELEIRALAAAGASVQPVLASLSDALQRIVDWRLPRVMIDGRSCSYGTAYGSNGERDYMRHVAKDALAALASSTPTKGGEAS